jgi:hypothetical protein
MDLEEAAPAPAPVQRKQEGAGAGGPASLPPGGGGAALPDGVRGKMEGSFGADFSQVRIHEGAHAQGLGALAYTQGTDVHFAPGQYQPESPAGQELLGHELAHVVQQSQGRVEATRQAKGVGINDDATLEREADKQGARAARGEPASGGGGAAADARQPVAGGGAAAPVQRFVGVGTGVELQGPIQAAALMGHIAAWVAPMQTVDQLRQARASAQAAQAGAPFRLGEREITMDEPKREAITDAVRRRVMARVVEVRAPFRAQLEAAHDPAARRGVQDQMRTAARPFLDELRGPGQPAARFEADPATQREVLAALELDGEGRAEDELADQTANGEAGPRSRARSVGHLPTGAWCGAFTYTQQRGAGLSEEARSAMHFTGPHGGIDAFLDYENRRRAIWTGSMWKLVQDYHGDRGSQRFLHRLPDRPTPVTPGSVSAPQGLDIQPGDIVLIDNARGTFADHITQCRTYDSSTGRLETIAGNEGGGDGRVAASATPRDLNTNPRAETVPDGASKPSRVYAYGRFSIVDYEVHTYLPAMPADPTESPEAMAAREHGGRRR